MSTVQVTLEEEVRRILLASIDVLIVSEAYQTRVALKQILGTCGSNRHMDARSLDEALETMRASPFHMVLLDLDLPGGALELVRKAQADSTIDLSRTRFALVVDKLTEADLKRAAQLGVSDILVRPFTTNRVVRSLLRAGFGD
jgi:DNA-binding response OmpR family regulator